MNLHASSTSNCSSHWLYIGTANGDLGRHTQIGEKDGYPFPIITHRTKVFQQVSPIFVSTVLMTCASSAIQVVYATSLTQVLTFGFTKLAVLLFYQRYVGLAAHLSSQQADKKVESSKADGSKPLCGSWWESTSCGLWASSSPISCSATLSK